MADRAWTGGLRLRLTHRIAAIGIVGVTGLLVTGAIYRGGIATQTRFETAADQAREQAQLSTRLKVELLESRRAEKDFLLRADDKYVAQHQDVSRSIQGSLDGLRKQGEGGSLGDRELSAKVEAIAGLFETYRRHFGALAEARRRLGLTENEGLEGTLRKSVHAIETVLRDLNEPRLMVTMLMMRRHEKDFMLRRDPKYGDDIRKRAAEFTTMLKASAADAAKQAEVAQKLDAYQRDVFAWMETAQVVAREQRALSETYARIDPVVAEIQNGYERLRADAEAQSAAVKAGTTWRMQAVIVAVSLAVAVMVLLIGGTISRPLTRMTAAMRELAGGNFDLILPGLGRRDEIGDMAGAVEAFKRKAIERARLQAEQDEASARAAAVERKAAVHRLADSFEQAVGAIVNTVSATAAQLQAAAQQLTGTAQSTQQLATAVAEAARTASGNVQSAASAGDELTTSFAEISRHVQESSAIAGDAVRQAGATGGRVAELSDSANRIGDVVALITSVAEQTNLLALNATIEAARAGEAGKGFAVVASEVKQLASQTAKATDEISRHIAGMQAATRDSVASIRDIDGTIQRIAGLATSMSAAAEEQSAAIREIARSVTQAAAGTTGVADKIGAVSRGATETQAASSQVLASARALAAEGDRLKSEVQAFLTTVRAA